MSQWIQHISGEGKIFEVWGQTTASWRVQAPHGSPIGLYDLPLEEYRLYDAPVVWEDVTEQCYVDDPSGQVYHKQSPTMSQCISIYSSSRSFCIIEGYRFRKVSGSSLAICGLKWAFVVERKKS